MKRFSRNIIYIFAAGLAGAFVFSCTQEEIIEPVRLSDPDAFVYIGNPTEACLDISVEGLCASMMTKGDGPVDDSEAERRVNDIWVFQYDAAKGNLISDPQSIVDYINVPSDNQELLSNIPVTLSDNNGSPCVVYVVANTGSNTWGKPDASYTGFTTLDELKKQTIPNPAPIRVNGGSGDDDVETSEAELSIPMGGSAGEDGSLIISNGTVVKVPVRRMFAKMEITVLLNLDNFDADMTSIMIDRIVNSSTVETCKDSDGNWYCPSTAAFDVSRSFVPNESLKGENEDGTSITYGTFIIYIPENLQSGDNSNAIKLTPYIKVTQNGAEIVSNPAYSVYPGSWSEEVTNPNDETEEYGTNFEVRRNCVYYVLLTINISEDDLVTPSANCIIASPGSTMAFYPYVRDEELTSEMTDGGTLEERYTFTTYLDPYDDTGKKKISYVKIIWQTDNCIGDNSAGNKVKIDPAGSDGDEERHRKIYVETAKSGNALIGAYNTDDEILWSWHIWVPKEGIDPEGGAIEYYHYLWDDTQIHTDSFVPGRLLMNLNLGATSERPSSLGTLDTDTYGMLYQWGRKDPFPPMRVTPDVAGTKGGSNFYDYADGSVAGSNSRNYNVVIGVSDNSDTKIDMTGNDGSIEYKGKYLFDTNAATSTGIGGNFGTSDNDVILNSVRNPTTFIAASPQFTATSTGTDASKVYLGDISNYHNEGDWLPVGDDCLWGGGHPSDGMELHVYTQESSGALVNNQTIDAYLEDDYGPNKTIFDPCPYGWRVSPGDIWLGFTSDGLNFTHTSGATEYLYSDNLGINVDISEMSGADLAKAIGSQCGFLMYMQGWQGEMGSAKSFFPTQGSRVTSGQPYTIGGICGNYHNATVDRPMNYGNNPSTPIRRVDILHFHTENKSNTTANDGDYILLKPFTNELWYYDKAVAGPLRCVRDTK